MKVGATLLVAIALSCAPLRRPSSAPNEARRVAVPGCNGYSTDAKNVYLEDELVVGADATSFRCLAAEFGKDRSFVYFGTTAFAQADPATFKVLAWGFSKDKAHVYYDYYSRRVIDRADPSSFVAITLFLGKDQSRLYQCDEQCSAVSNVDVSTFRLEHSCYMDKNFLYAHDPDARTMDVLSSRNADLEEFLCSPHWRKFIVEHGAPNERSATIELGHNKISADVTYVSSYSLLERVRIVRRYSAQSH